MYNDVVRTLLQEIKQKKTFASGARHTRSRRQKGSVILPSSRIDRRKNRSYKSGPVTTYNLRDLTETQAKDLGLLNYWREVV